MQAMPQNTKETGTTTVGLTFKDGLVLASESKSTLGFMVSSKEAQKIYKIEDRMAITTAGGAGDTQAIARVLMAEIALYKNMRQADVTVQAVASLTSNILQSSRYYPYLAMLILGGYDTTGPHIYSIDLLGGAEEDKYTSTGSGSPFAYGVLENEFREGMSREEVIRLSVRAIRSARERDVMSGGRIVVMVITKDGIEMVPDEKISDIITQ